MFGSKRKLRKQEEERIRQKEKEIEGRIRIKKSLSGLRNQSNKLETFKKQYIEKGRQAAAKGDKVNYDRAKIGLKQCLSKQKVLDSMLCSLEMSVQLNDMNKVVGEFITGMNTISEQMMQTTSSFDMAKAQMAYEKAMANNADQYQALDAYLESAQDTIKDFDGVDSSISDEEVEAMITKGDEADNKIDREIEQQMQALKASI